MNTFKIDIHINIYNAKYHQADNDKLTQREVGNNCSYIYNLLMSRQNKVIKCLDC